MKKLALVITAQIWMYLTVLMHTSLLKTVWSPGHMYRRPIVHRTMQMQEWKIETTVVRK